MNKSLLKHTLQYLIAICALFFIIRYFLEHRGDLDLIRNITLRQAMYIGGIMLAINALVSYKILLILRHLELKTISFYGWFRIFIISRFINFHVTQGGNLYRIAKLKQAYGFPYTQALSMTIFFIWIETILNLLFSIAIIFFFQQRLNLKYHNALTSIALSIIALAVLPAGLRFILRCFPSQTKHLAWIWAKLKDLTERLSEQTQNIRLLLQFAILTCVIFTLFNAAVYVSFQAINIHLDLPQTALFTVVLLLSRTINVTPGNIGLAEIVCGYLSQNLGATLGSGIIVVGIFRIIEYLLLGILFLIFNKTFFKATKEAENQK